MWVPIYAKISLSIAVWLINSGHATGSSFHSAPTFFQFPKIKFVGISQKQDLNPPQILVQNGAGETENLRKKLEEYCATIDRNSSSGESSINGSNNLSICWEPHLKEGYEVADVIFGNIAHNLRDGNNHEGVEEYNAISPLVFSFPSMSQPEHLEKLATVLQSDKCKLLLGLEDAVAELYPSSPAPYLRVTFSPLAATNEAVNDQFVPDSSLAESASATEDWINKFLGKYRLCPYTSSVSRAAVGLSSVGVPVGGVHVRVESTNGESDEARQCNSLKAAGLVSAFWSEVRTLMQSPQKEWATSLVVFPEYDTEFAAFVDVCDTIVEPTVVATQSTNFIGRAWFHPQYDADAVGHSEVIAGHAVPHKMVEGFMKSLQSTSGKDGVELEYDQLVKANNIVRRTPHATINILRRSQLTAAGEYEKGLGEKRPKANSIYVRNALRISKALKKTTII